MQLIVLIHGMWGTARDFKYIVNELSNEGFVCYDELEKYEGPTPRGVVYCTRSNEGYFTYDGIDVCGLRIANEITNVMKSLQAEDYKITHLSLVGYSMGGLMARYAIGLLYTRRMFDNIKPHVFVTTCSPHIGVNVLGSAMGPKLFNAIGAWSMARTSQQAFLCDSDQKGGLPLFLFLTQQKTACTHALSLFSKRVLYANVANDHRCEFYTSGAEATDPFKGKDLNLLRGPFVPGYEPILLRNASPDFGTPSADEHNSTTPSLLSRLKYLFAPLLRFGGLTLKLTVVLPLWFCAFLINAGYQRTASFLRIRRSVADGDLLDFEGVMEDVYNSVQKSSKRAADPHNERLELTPLMSRIINQFNHLGWEKYFVRITGTSKAHSAAIMKMAHRKDFVEGKVVVRHLVKVLTGPESRNMSTKL